MRSVFITFKDADRRSESWDSVVISIGLSEGFYSVHTRDQTVRYPIADIQEIKETD
jgi:hypothetical protein